MNAEIIMNCPACNAPVEPEEDLEVGESLECDQCEALLVVVGGELLVIDLDEEEDDDESDDLDEDEDLEFDDEDDFEEEDDEEED